MLSNRGLKAFLLPNGPISKIAQVVANYVKFEYDTELLITLVNN